MTSTNMTGRIDEFSNDDSSPADGNGQDWLLFAIEEQEGGYVSCNSSEGNFVSRWEPLANRKYQFHRGVEPSERGRTTRNLADVLEQIIAAPLRLDYTLIYSSFERFISFDDRSGVSCCQMNGIFDDA